MITFKNQIVHEDLLNLIYLLQSILNDFHKPIFFKSKKSNDYQMLPAIRCLYPHFLYSLYVCLFPFRVFAVLNDLKMLVRQRIYLFDKLPALKDLFFVQIFIYFFPKLLSFHDRPYSFRWLAQLVLWLCSSFLLRDSFDLLHFVDILNIFKIEKMKLTNR